MLLVGRNGTPLAVREFQVKGGAYVISELLAFDERKRWFKYRILKTNLPLSSYVAEMWVEPAPKGGSVVKWSAQFQRPEETPKPDQDDAATTKLVQGVFKAGLDNIATLNSKQAMGQSMEQPMMAPRLRTNGARLRLFALSLCALLAGPMPPWLHVAAMMA